MKELRHTNSRPTAALNSLSSHAFTLLETLTALAVLSISLAGLYAGLTRINEYAAVNRLYSCATALVEDRIDRSLAVSPFSITDNTVPPELVVSSSSYPVAIYVDPDQVQSYLSGTAQNYLLATNSTLIGTPNQAVVTGTMSTLVTSCTVAAYSGTNAQNVVVQHTTVSLQYTFHGKSYQVQMDSLRSPD